MEHKFWLLILLLILYTSLYPAPLGSGGEEYTILTGTFNMKHQAFQPVDIAQAGDSLFMLLHNFTTPREGTCLLMYHNYEVDWFPFYFELNGWIAQEWPKDLEYSHGRIFILSDIYHPDIGESFYLRSVDPEHPAGGSEKNAIIIPPRKGPPCPRMNKLAFLNDFIYIVGENLTRPKWIGVLEKYSLDGDLIWSREWGSDLQSHKVNDFIVDEDSSSLYMVGRGKKDENRLICLFKMDEDGSIVWKKEIPQSGIVDDVRLAVDGGDIYLTYIPSWALCSISPAVIVVKYDSSGSLLFNQTINLEGVIGISPSSYVLENHTLVVDIITSKGRICEVNHIFISPTGEYHITKLPFIYSPSLKPIYGVLRHGIENGKETIYGLLLSVSSFFENWFLILTCQYVEDASYYFIFLSPDYVSGYGMALIGDTPFIAYSVRYLNGSYGFNIVKFENNKLITLLNSTSLAEIEDVASYGDSLYVVSSENSSIWKFNSNGQLEWSKAGGSNNYLCVSADDTGIYVGGSSSLSGILQKFSHSGTLVWEIQPIQEVEIYDIELYGDKIYMTGPASNGTTFLGAVSKDGEIEWVKCVDIIEGKGDRTSQIKLGPNGEIVLRVFGKGFFIVVLDSEGNILSEAKRSTASILPTERGIYSLAYSELALFDYDLNKISSVGSYIASHTFTLMYHMFSDPLILKDGKLYTLQSCTYGTLLLRIFDESEFLGGSTTGSTTSTEVSSTETSTSTTPSTEKGYLLTLIVVGAIIVFLVIILVFTFLRRRRLPPPPPPPP